MADQTMADQTMADQTMADQIDERQTASTLRAEADSASANSAGNNVEHELQLLEAIATTPETTQANLAAQVGVAVGTVNWYLKRWSKKGYIKIRRISRWQWSYLLTPEGIARKARLASEYVEASLSLYRRTRAEAKLLLTSVRATGAHHIILAGDGEIAEICRLTCLEMGIDIVAETTPQHQLQHVPMIRIEGVRLVLIWSGVTPADDGMITR
ncbi:MAG: winged helix-turn-helix transcriptional regulator [Caldilinea sp. CFX5]|nr:winged helix-turn-helix transcriptional regulator [Caldilinea sp. CFX5]